MTEIVQRLTGFLSSVDGNMLDGQRAGGAPPSEYNLKNSHQIEETKDLRACHGYRRDGMSKSAHIGEVKKSTRHDTVNTSGRKYRHNQGTSVAHAEKWAIKTR